MTERIIECSLCGLMKVVDDFGDLHHIGLEGQILYNCSARNSAIHFNEKMVKR